MRSHQGKEEKLRGWMVDASLGQLGARERAHLARELARDAALRAEFEQIEDAVRTLRSSPGLRPSARFRRSLERRLDACDAAVPVELAERVRFQVLFLGHRLRTSSRTRWLAIATAASLIAAVLLGWTLSRNAEQSSSGSAWQPLVARESAPASDPEPPAANHGLVEQPLRPESIGRLEDHVPAFVDAEHRSQLEDPGLESLRWDQELDSELELPEGSVPLRPRNVDPLPPSAVGRLSVEELAAGVPRRDRAGSASDRVEAPVERALGWLWRQQKEDGSWSPGSGDPDLEIAVTALATLAFVSDGVLGVSDGVLGVSDGVVAVSDGVVAVSDGAVAVSDGVAAVSDGVAAVSDGVAAVSERTGRDWSVRKAVEFLLSCQTTHGAFGSVLRTDPALFNQATACLALLEHYAACQRARCGDALVDRVRSGLLLGLNRLEDQFQRLIRSAGSDESDFELEGEDAAWSALTLATARRTQHDWQLDPFSEAEARRMFERLQPTVGGREATVAASRAIHAMLAAATGFEETDEWNDLVGKILFRPDLSDAALRFLVASAMAPWGRSLDPGSQKLWDDFRSRLESSVLVHQDPTYGYFVVPMQAGFRGGDVYDTALCVLTLTLLAGTGR